MVAPPIEPALGLLELESIAFRCEVDALYEDVLFPAPTGPVSIL